MLLGNVIYIRRHTCSRRISRTLVGLVAAVIAQCLTNPPHVFGPRYHTIVTVGSFIPFFVPALHVRRPVVPSWQQTRVLAGVTTAHFTGQLLLHRGFSLDDVSHGAALFAQQVRGQAMR